MSRQCLSLMETGTRNVKCFVDKFSNKNDFISFETGVVSVKIKSCSDSLVYQSQE